MLSVVVFLDILLQAFQLPVTFLFCSLTRFFFVVAEMLSSSENEHIYSNTMKRDFDDEEGVFQADATGVMSPTLPCRSPPPPPPEDDNTYAFPSVTSGSLRR